MKTEKGCQASLLSYFLKLVHFKEGESVGQAEVVAPSSTCHFQKSVTTVFATHAKTNLIDECKQG
jgi:hypothetical protein